MKFTALQIATILNGDIEGDELVAVSKLSKIEEGESDSISFLANDKYTNYLYTTKAGIVIVNRDFIPEKPVKSTLIKVSDAYAAFTSLLQFYNDTLKTDKTGIESPVFIDESVVKGERLYVGAFSYIGKHVKLGNNVKIFPQVYIGDNVEIGDDTTIFSGTRIYNDTKIGKACTVHANVVLGSDGFGFAPNKDGTYNKIPQTGNVVIEDQVEIGAGTTIDRATMGSTIIRTGVKLDNMIMIAHNVEVGAHTVIAAQSGIAGSTKVGKHCVLGGQVGIVGHLTIGNHVKIQAQSGITKSLKDGEVVQGTPAFEYSEWNRSYIHFKNLPKTMKDIQDQLKK
ncbi:MAG: UDP-3-O-(3-hydroxymyristoyl)glucosamine N-acyltransferase [Flavobacteriia bacterium]|nr:MAG: UDP-3-O-(3-hydroxymyristoyl)glucosamine N-acyltransferase [Flavobacteriia bacterium]